MNNFEEGKVIFEKAAKPQKVADSTTNYQIARKCCGMVLDTIKFEKLVLHPPDLLMSRKAD